jgi:RNA polymerase sigma-70 factor, ECF subfamily
MHATGLYEFLERFIDELPEGYRLAYILKDIEKLTEDKVCDILRISKSTMKNRVHRARLVIRQRIEDEFVKNKAVTSVTPQFCTGQRTFRPGRP